MGRLIQGEEFNTDVYSSSYQEQMLKLAISEALLKQSVRISLVGNFKIKTLALFS